MLRTKSRGTTVLATANYLMAIALSAFYHEHHGCDEEQPRSGVSASRVDDDHDCSICQFLAQKPSPAAVASSFDLSALAQGLAAPLPEQATVGIFSAWHSRAPPALV